MKVFVTGARGMLGGDLCRALAGQGHDVYATDLPELDVSQPARVQSTVRQYRPDIIFHLAALTDVDRCEQYPSEAFRVNAVGTQNVALACQAAEIPLVYVSTISVFSGLKAEAYTEYDEPDPQSRYSRSKYEGEKIVQRLLRRFFIVRAGWMFGGRTEDKKFVAKILDLARTRSEISAVNDKFGSPTYTCDFAEALIQLVKMGWYGLYHAVNTGQPCSRFEYAQQIVESAGITTCNVVPVTSDAFPQPAPRPRMEAGQNLHSELLGLHLMRPWREALQEYIHANS